MEITTIRRLAKKLNLQNLARAEFELKETAMSNLNYLQFVLQKELKLREDRQLVKYQKASKLPLIQFDEKNLQGITKWQFNEIMKLQWLANDENIIVVGRCNTGKTAIVAKIGSEGVVQGNKVYYIKMDKFLEVIKSKEIAPKARATFSYITECQQIIIDEVMYANVTREELQLFYKAITFLNETHSIVIVTNRELSDWKDASEDKHLMQTLVERLTAKTQILHTDKLESLNRKTLKKEVKKI